MKARYIIHADQGYISTVFEGSVTLPELGTHIQTIWSDPAWKSDYNGILDFSGASFDLSAEEVRALTVGLRGIHGGGL